MSTPLAPSAAGATPPLRIQLQGVWKRYGLPLPALLHQGEARLRRVLGLSPPADSLPWALQEISFSSHGGETLGVIGRNGSGKSTLLKVIAGVSPTTQGKVETFGAIFPMIELNAGIHGDLSGRENIHILGAIMGLAPAHVRQLMPEIEAFCELGAWFDRPVRTYSSGMLVRLGFAVGIHVQADILLMDEVMAVGDIQFHNKCMHQLERVRSDGAAVLFVSHSMLRIRRMCDRVLVLDQGRQLYLGEVEEGVRLYEALQAERTAASAIPDLRQTKTAHPNFDHEGMRLITMELRPVGGGPPLESVPQGADVEILFTLETPLAMVQTGINLALETPEGLSVVWSLLELPVLPVGRTSFIARWYNLRLKAGLYQVRLGVVTGQFMIKALRSSDRLLLRMEGNERSALGIHTPQEAFFVLETLPLEHPVGEGA